MVFMYNILTILTILTNKINKCFRIFIRIEDNSREKQIDLTIRVSVLQVDWYKRI